ncbi:MULTISPECIES: phosphoribosylglycinamide formyltransferase [Aerococcus]|uniref:Phosphoribosylglycinamide formyltransferase n=1 Tax=Aerococcus sanguinicola TaxID=119206 RepID=A0A5N1GJM5_9LACT|nr:MULTISPECIES: phosphoribosylglycinamide formyltransferase [Aerococcus]KAA9301185.1 phosphoribosylglycinamide formyltransferase [Aerococcus sanguinicola]MDK6369285.1 phosphoribosylglycinamide formyltransferase [Aerococcus sp. UMB9870]MDK6679109.1 phosphoribosylglycinamide formyltransferase [Aerococcus sp. UMB8608]MDK6687016.1 phosphoribosylglycinamide formyltransferase [Aerococcus sp. UMB8623]MDK6941162.1 phosphoribosylglycinamide formyltransferase [Aerococcus sp. UMB8487]
MRCAVFASGNGSNFQALAQAFSDGQEGIDLVFLFSDQAGAHVLDRAEPFGIKTYHFSPEDFANRQGYEEALLKLCQEEAIDWIILAGYMRVLHAPLVQAYPQAIINIHPSLLPAFPGRHGIRDAYQAGVEETGVTVHYVDAGIDSGEIIAQVHLPIEAGESLAQLEERIHQLEHQVYPAVIRQLKGREDAKSLN